MSNFLNEISSNPDVGHVAAGHVSVTGTETVVTGLANAITSCVAGLEVVDVTALSGFVVGCAPNATHGSIDISVYDSSGDAATAAVVVSWFACDV